VNFKFHLPVSIACLLLAGAPLSLPAKAKPGSAATAIDAEYVAALAGANNFLHAWQSQDRETGLLMLTDAAKQGVSEDRLRDLLSPGSSSPRSYEISRGKRVDAGRFAFPVALFDMHDENQRTRPRFSRIVVIKTGRQDWSVDRLP
jgi:hypothetical protein